MVLLNELAYWWVQRLQTFCLFGRLQIYSPSRVKCMYAMVPDEMMKLPVTCVRFCPLPVDDDQAQRSHVIAASCMYNAMDVVREISYKQNINSSFLII